MQCNLSKLLEFGDFWRRIQQDPNDLFAGHSMGDKKNEKFMNWFGNLEERVFLSTVKRKSFDEERTLRLFFNTTEQSREKKNWVEKFDS